MCVCVCVYVCIYRAATARRESSANADPCCALGGFTRGQQHERVTLPMPADGAPLPSAPRT